MVAGSFARLTIAALATALLSYASFVQAADAPALGKIVKPNAAQDPELQTALKDYEENNFPVALKEFKAAAIQGNRIAKFDYAMMLLNGEGVTADIPNALIWLKKAADANMSHAQFTYARLYDDGQVVPPDLPKAHYWFLRAAKQGHTEAEIALANQFMDGRGTPRSYAEAFKWYLKAAKKGDTTSEYIVASFYERGGDGVKIDLPRAKLWYALAAVQGDPAAAYKYDAISKKLRKQHPEKNAPEAAPDQSVQPIPNTGPSEDTSGAQT